MIENLVPQASTFASDIDQLWVVLCVIVFFWFACAEGMFLWLLWRFRYQEGVPAQYVTGNEKHLKRWITWPHALIILCDVVVIVGAVRVWYNVKQDLPEPDYTIGVMAQQWAWSFVHPGEDGELGTEDDVKTVDDLHLVVGKTYHFKLQSRDVLHSFSIPVFRLKQDALPGREITGWFQPTKTGTYDIQCTEMCGIGHGIMSAHVVIETPEQHEAWLASGGN
jgi:cytochrome c oxidase subunit 2